MSLLVHLRPTFDYISHVRDLLPHRFALSPLQKVVVVSVGAGAILVGVVGILSRYMRRKKQAVDPSILRRNFIKRLRSSGVRSPNNRDVISLASSGKRSLAHSSYSDRRQNSVLSERTSLGSGSAVSGHSHLVINEGGDGNRLTPQQLGVMGMEALETSINYWEDALAAYRSNERALADGRATILDPQEAAFCSDLQQLLEAALALQERSELLFLDERSVLFHHADNGRRHAHNDDGDAAEHSTGESFASAQDQVADLREFEEFADEFPNVETLPLYQAALRHLEDGAGIPCRCLRTELVRCGSDGEYLAKLHCLRLSFQHLLRDSNVYHFFVDAGRQILADLLIYADRDPKEFLIGYEEMLRFLQNPDNWRDLEEELGARGVKALTFYDVVLDYVLMDAFEDLDAPPSSVTAVVQNRWLSDGFKETALTTAVWSVLKAKRRMLRQPKGFMAHFYAISEQISPVLAWGFLGPDEILKETCLYFREQVMGFLVDIFSFQRCNYVGVETLSENVLGLLRVRVEAVCRRLSAQGYE